MDLASFVFTALPPPPARVLEVGCGAGNLARAMDAAGYAVLAVTSVSANDLARARS